MPRSVPGGYTNVGGRGHARVPWAALEPYIRPWIATKGCRWVARRAGVDESALARLVRGDAAYLRPTTADKLICRVLGDPYLWHTEPALAAVFERAA